MDLRQRGVLLRARLVVDRAGRRWRRQVEEELGSYATQRERDDLLATFDRYPDDVTQVYRDVVDRRSRSAGVPRWPAMGGR